MKHIDDFFREKLGNYTETPPADVWDDLDSRLDTLKPPAPNNGYRRLLHVAMVSLILILGVSLVRNMILNANKGPETLASNTNTTNSAAQNNNAPNTNTTESPASTNGAAATNNNNIPGNDNNGINNPSSAAVAATAEQSKSQATESAATGTPARNRPTAAAQKNKKLNNGALAGTHGNVKAGKGAAYTSEKGTKHGPDADADQAENEYGSAVGQSAKNKTTAAENNTTSTKLKEEVSATKKPVANSKPEPKKDDKKQTSKPRFVRLEAGMKVGFETGFSTAAGNKMVVSPYILYKVSHKFSVMLQPAVKYANLSSKAFSSQSYYQANDDGMVVQDGPSKIKTTTTGGSVHIDSWTTTYTATQSHDSIVKSYNHGGSYMEFEIPVLLKYNLSKKLSVYGGVSAVYSQVTGIKENTTTVKNIQRSVDETIVTTTPPVAPGVGDMIKYNGTPYSNYTGPLTASQKAQLRAGYMLGFSYEPGKRLLFDVLTQISPSNPIMKGGYDVSTPSSPYFRLSVGYKLTK